MKGINDAWNNVYKPMHNGWLFRAKLVKGDNSLALLNNY